MSKKDSYIYKISKVIHKGMKIHCIEHKINIRHDEGCNPRSQLCSAWAPLSHFFFLAACFLSFLFLVLYILAFLCLSFYSKREEATRPTCPSELVASLGEWHSKILQKWPFFPFTLGLCFFIECVLTTFFSHLITT